MSEIIRLRDHGQLTLPASTRREAGLEPGQVFEVELTSEGIVLRPKELVDADQAYFWTERWQRGEREAEADVREGRVERFETVDDLLDDLDG